MIVSEGSLAKDRQTYTHTQTCTHLLRHARRHAPHARAHTHAHTYTDWRSCILYFFKVRLKTKTTTKTTTTPQPNRTNKTSDVSPPPVVNLSRVVLAAVSATTMATKMVLCASVHVSADSGLEWNLS